jgi:hypothetical protein
MAGVDDVLQTLGGFTLQQPWLGRKIWKGSEPIRFTIPLEFVTIDKAHDDVWLPVVGLMSLVYPRKESDGDTAGMAESWHIPGPTPFQSFVASVSGGDTAGTTLKGDSVSVQIGTFLYFSLCIIDDVQVTLSNTFDAEGYPNHASVKVTVESQDPPFVKANGAFMVDSFKNSAFEVGNLIDEAVKIAKRLKDFTVDSFRLGESIGDSAFRAMFPQ